MEFQKIINLLDTTFDDKDLPRFVTKKWIEVYDQSEINYSVNKEIRIKTPMLRSDWCDFSDAYIVVKGEITFIDPNNVNYEKNLAFKNNAPFINFISNLKIPLIYCEVELILTWYVNYLLTSKATIDADPDENPPVAATNNPTNAIFKIKDTKLYVHAVTLSTENDIKLLEKLKLGFKRTIKWNK